MEDFISDYIDLLLRVLVSRMLYSFAHTTFLSSLTLSPPSVLPHHCHPSLPYSSLIYSPYSPLPFIGSYPRYESDDVIDIYCEHDGIDIYGTVQYSTCVGID